MKIFNVLVVALWLLIYGVSLTPTNEESPFDLHDNLIYNFNETVVDLVYVADAHSGEGIPLVSEKYTQAILQETFGWVMFFVGMANFFYYAGKGTFGNWATHVTNGFEMNIFGPMRRWKNRRNMRQDMERSGITIRNSI